MVVVVVIDDNDHDDDGDDDNINPVGSFPTENLEESHST